MCTDGHRSGAMWTGKCVRKRPQQARVRCGARHECTDVVY